MKLLLLLLLLSRSLSHDNSRRDVSLIDIWTRVVVERHTAEVGAHPLVDHALGKVNARPGAWHQHGCSARIGWCPDRQNCLSLADRSNICLDILNCRNSIGKRDVGPIAAFLYFAGPTSSRTDARVRLLLRFRRKEAEISGMSVPLFTVARVYRILGLFCAKTDGRGRLFSASESRSVVVVVVEMCCRDVITHRFVQVDKHIAKIKNYRPPFFSGVGVRLCQKIYFQIYIFSFG